jgi:hypothetical protein
VYLDRIVSSFLAHPPSDLPPGLDSRAEEKRLAGACEGRGSSGEALPDRRSG